MAKIKNYSSTSHKHRPKNVSPKAFEKAHWPYLPAWIAFFVGTVVLGATELGATGAIVGGTVTTIAAIAIAL